MQFINIVHQDKKSTLGSTHYDNGKLRDPKYVGKIIPAETLGETFRLLGDKEGYFQLFDLEAGLTDYAGFFGPHRPALSRLFFDFDSEQDVELSRKDSLAFVQRLSDLGADTNKVIIRFSGKKGFHIAVPAQWFGISEECWDEQSTFRSFCISLKKDYAALDTSVSSTVGRIRIPGSRHDGSGLYSTRLSLSELQTLSISDILIKAKTHSVPSDDECVHALGHIVKKIQDWYLESASEVLEAESKEIFSHFNHTLTTYPDKPCIKQLEQDRVPPSDRHHAMLVLASDFSHTKVPESACENRLRAFATKVGLSDDRVRRDPTNITRAVYRGRQQYSYGCKDSLKASRCSALCPIRDTLKPENKPPLTQQKIEADQELAKQTPALKPQPLSKHSGYWIPQGKQKVPAYEDLLTEFHRELNYQTWTTPTGTTRTIVWNGKHWAPLLDIDHVSKTWLEKNMRPAPMEKHRSEFAAKVKANNCSDGLRDPAVYQHFFEKSIEHKINLANGVFDLQTGELETRTLDLGFTYVLPFDFKKDAKCPRFKQFLYEITDGDQHKIDLMMLFITYAMFDPHYSRQYILFLLGGGGNGKGTFTRFVSKLFGGVNGGYANLTVESFTQRFDSPMMEGKLIGAIEEVSEGGTNKTVWNGIKELSGRGLLRVERKNKDMYAIPATCKFILCANEEPTLKDNSLGLQRRFRMVRLEKNFTENSNFDPYLDEKLEAELSGVFNWIIEEYKDRYIKNGIPETETNRESLRELLYMEDPTLGFIETCLEPVKDGAIKGLNLKAAFQEWCKNPDTGFVESDARFHSYKRLTKKIRIKYGEKCFVRRSDGYWILGLGFKKGVPADIKNAKHIGLGSEF